RTRKIDELEQTSKLDQLRVYGIPECSSDLLERKLHNIFKNNLGIQTSIASLVYFNKKKLKGIKMIVTEELVKNRFHHRVHSIIKQMNPIEFQLSSRWWSVGFRYWGRWFIVSIGEISR
ncbi:unnamed protein product, partial [Acanthoscelides obtectus]